MANKIVIRMLEDGMSIADLSALTDIAEDTLWRVITSGDGQVTSEENARAITKALTARLSTLFVDQGDGRFLPRVRG